MSLNAQAIAVLLSKGLDGDDILEVALALETDADQRSSAAKRQARYRKRQKEGVTGDVTGDVTPPPKDNSKPHSVSDETGASADPVKELFDLGVTLLKSQGHSERESRSIVGSWRKGRSPGEVVAALVDAKTRSISNLVEWMPKRLNGRQTGPPGGDFMEHYERELEQRTVTN